MFKDREEAAGLLADAVAACAPTDPIVLALPRGGVPLGVIVANKLVAPLDLLLVRKIGMPGHDELAAGAIVDGDPPVTLFNRVILAETGLDEVDFGPQIDQLRDEIKARRARYLPERVPVPVRDRTVVLVDDGIATGATIRVAIMAIRQADPAAIWVAVPVAPNDTIPLLETEADRVICLETPDPFWSVGTHYRTFGQVSDDEVVQLLKKGWT